MCAFKTNGKSITLGAMTNIIKTYTPPNIVENRYACKVKMKVSYGALCVQLVYIHHPGTKQPTGHKLSPESGGGWGGLGRTWRGEGQALRA